MINYSDDEIFNTKNKICLKFDPFIVKDKYKNLLLDDISKDKLMEFDALFEEGMKNKNKNKILKYFEIRKNYYNCSNECFTLHKNLSVMNYHYDISCMCIQDCFNSLIDLNTKIE